MIASILEKKSTCHDRYIGAIRSTDKPAADALPEISRSRSFMRQNIRNRVMPAKTHLEAHRAGQASLPRHHQWPAREERPS